MKKVTVVPSVAERCTTTLTLNKKLAGPKFGRQLNAVAAALGQLGNPGAVAETLARGGSVSVVADGSNFVIEPGMVEVTRSYGDDYIAAGEGALVVLFDARITDELRREGIARDIVRHVQVTRKDAGLELEDRIVLSLQSDADLLQAAIDQCGDYIAQETLAEQMTADSLSDAAGTSEVKIAGQPLRIELRKR